MDELTKAKNHWAGFLATAGLCAGAIYAAQTIRRRVPQKFSLARKSVLITGGSRGFGLAMAEEFGKAGARIAICARDRAEIERACEQLRAKQIEIQGFAADLTKADEINTLLSQVLSQFGSIDVLVNDAGAISVGPFDSFGQSDFEEAMNLMFWAPVHLTRAVLPHMQRAGGGQIVNIASLGGRVSVPHLLPYCCAKFALVGFSTGLTTEVKAQGIRVLTVTPGLMRTGSYLNAQFKGHAKEEFAWFGLLGNIPGFSVAAEYAAAQVRGSIERGDQTCTISLPAKLLIALEGLAPDINRSLLEFATALLPSPGGQQALAGKQLDSKLPSIFQKLTVLGKMAAQQWNER